MHWYFNDRLIPAEEPVLQLNELGLLRGFGIFDFFLVEEGTPIFYEGYEARFLASARKLGLPLPLSTGELRRAIAELLQSNGESNAAIRLLLTGGYSPDGYRPGPSHLAILQHPFVPYPAEKCERGIGLQLNRYQRQLPEIKTTNYLNGIRLLPLLQAAGDLEPLYHDHGYVRETVRSNFWLVDEEGSLVTPKRGVLQGITRARVLDLARRDMPVQQRAVRVGELSRAREAFITGTSKRVMPVVRIDGRPVGDGQPGPVTRELMSRFERLKQEARKRSAARPEDR
jgi:branched-subunit amino acid aminotransferase/4-amino-4-deoxychorismate lyase